MLEELEKLIDGATRGDPMSPLKWTCKSTEKIVLELKQYGHQVSKPTVRKILGNLGYSLQSNRKIKEGTDHPDCDAQFCYIAKQIKDSQVLNQPVISVDTKKKN